MASHGNCSNHKKNCLILDVERRDFEVCSGGRLSMSSVGSWMSRSVRSHRHVMIRRVRSWWYGGHVVGGHG